MRSGFKVVRLNENTGNLESVLDYQLVVTYHPGFWAVPKVRRHWLFYFDCEPDALEFFSWRVAAGSSNLQIWKIVVKPSFRPLPPMDGIWNFTRIWSYRKQGDFSEQWPPGTKLAKAVKLLERTR